MQHHRHIFQYFYSNRLRQHQLVSIYKHDSIHSQLIGGCHQFQRTKCNMMTNKNKIQQFNSNDLHRKISYHQSNVNTSKKPLPFEAIPCDSSSTTKWNRLIETAVRLKGLITNDFDQRFHEEIEECHQRLGPIFRKCLPQYSSKFYKLVFFYYPFIIIQTRNCC